MENTERPGNDASKARWPHPIPAQLLLQVQHVLVALSIVGSLRFYKLMETAKVIHLKGEDRLSAGLFVIWS